jgi:tyrosine-specific transport protein
VVAGVAVPLAMFLAWDAVILGSLGGSGGAARADPLAALASTSPAVGVLIQVRACVHVLGKGGLACAVSWPSPGLRQLPGVGASVAHVRIAVGSAACETELQGCCLHLSTLWY